MSSVEQGIEQRRGGEGGSGWLVARAKRDLPFFLIAAAVLGFDQLTKSVIRANLSLGESWPSDDWLVKITHVTNTGAAFGILQGQGVFLTITAFLGMGAIIFYYAFPPLEHGLLRAALGLQLGGAIGNLMDRLRFGEVTDFVHFPHYPAFNVADSSIVVGLVIIVGFFVLREGHRGEDKPSGGESG
ncbi:MAG TPA: signal peptidase II [Dehalococcoidia bacterium]|jgi:signal peptidase II|nr:signal peptidase II [Dehalococcoidia bacterium]